jgi:hypothetical protein
MSGVSLSSMSRSMTPPISSAPRMKASTKIDCWSGKYR